MDDKKYVNPLSFQNADLPLICLVDDRRGFFGWGIKAHEHGNYNHACVIHRPGFVATQGFDNFKEVPIATYFTNSQFIKFWKIKDLTTTEKNQILQNINTRLKASATGWRKHFSYDWLGIFGQFFHLNFIQNPWQVFCSEEVRIDYIQCVGRASKVFPKEPSPSDIDNIANANSEIMECVGYCWKD